MLVIRFDTVHVVLAAKNVEALTRICILTTMFVCTAQLYILLPFVVEDISQWRGVDRSERCKSGTSEAEARKRGVLQWRPKGRQELALS